MARHYSSQEALDIIMHSDCEDVSSSSSVDSEADTEEASEVGTDQLESNSDSSEAESGGTCTVDRYLNPLVTAGLWSCSLYGGPVPEPPRYRWSVVLQPVRWTGT
ncbi:hypothetical protein JOQ06_007917 [Pogonophryne albipinna]|uniref:Uncharacterized protein n=1 Tax=Pogonophryne albipinna TaxID=1090488 RepID=A0AAD6F2X0_9TELE|nr:hypothetical protein JOQ06_007917 [Pogonophryne albipinna]